MIASANAVVSGANVCAVHVLASAPVKAAAGAARPARAAPAASVSFRRPGSGL